MIICPQCQTINEVSTTRCASCGGSLLAAETLQDDDPFVGHVYGGRFQLQARLGSGEIGMVYRGLDTTTGQEATIKLIHPDVAASIGEGLLASGRQLMKLSHPKIARILAASREADGTIYIASEHVRGQTLKTLLEANGPLGPRRAADILFQLCSALAPIHRLGRPHANLKPENVFLVEREGGADFVQIVDVGVPELFGNRQTPEGQVVIGTPKYFSPEQATGRKVGMASDQFTLGIIGYQLLTGALPFFGATPDQLLNAIATATPTPVSKRTAGVSLPARLEQVVDRCLVKDPAGRYPDLRGLATDLAEIIKSTQPDAAPPPRPRAKPGFINASTVVAGPDLLGDDDDDGERTVARDIPSEATPNMGAPVQMLMQSVRSDRPTGPVPPKAPPGAAQIIKPAKGAPPPPTQNDMASIPEPLLVTGALDSDDLAAALNAAARSMGHDDVQVPVAPKGPGTLIGPPRKSPSPVEPPPSAKKGPKVDDDLDAAFAAALADVGMEGEAPAAKLASRPVTPSKGAPAARAPTDPFAGMSPSELPGSPEGRAAEAAARSPRPSAQAARMTTEIMSAIDEEVVDVSGPVPSMARNSPLATAADLMALAPPTTAKAKAAPGSAAAGGAKKPNKTALLAMGAALIVIAGGAVFFFLQSAPQQSEGPIIIDTRKPGTQSVAAAQSPSAAPVQAGAAVAGTAGAAPSAAPVSAAPSAAGTELAAPPSVAAGAVASGPALDELGCDPSAPPVVYSQCRKQKEAEKEAARQKAIAEGLVVGSEFIVNLTSNPEGATVKCGDRAIGKTPVTDSYNTAQACEYEFSLEGYEVVKRGVGIKEAPANGTFDLAAKMVKKGAPPPAPKPRAPASISENAPRPPAPKPPAPRSAAPKPPKSDTLKDPFE